MGDARRRQPRGPGSRLGRYELVLRVAAGGMGEVWAARLRGKRGFRKLFAVKMLLPELSHDPKFERMFLAEAELASRIVHPNVVPVVDLGEADDALYQVMEWVTGVSLFSLMRAVHRARRKVPLAVTARMIAQLCAGLHAAHELRAPDGTSLGLVHRDVSPQNVMITTGGVARVLDFGVAHVAGRGAAVTAAGEVKGKVPYVAPEHALGLPTDRRGDVFAVGVILHELLSGEHPFLADDDRVTLARIASADPAPPLGPPVPDELSKLVAEALAKSPDERIESAAALARRLEKLVPSASLQSSDQEVARFVRELTGAELARRAGELREAIALLDGSSLETPDGGSEPRAVDPRSPSAPQATPAHTASEPHEIAEGADAWGTDAAVVNGERTPPRVHWPGPRRGVRAAAGAAAVAAAASAAVHVRSDGAAPAEPANAPAEPSPAGATVAVEPSPSASAAIEAQAPAGTAAGAAVVSLPPGDEARGPGSDAPATEPPASATGGAPAPPRRAAPAPGKSHAARQGEFKPGGI